MKRWQSCNKVWLHFNFSARFKREVCPFCNKSFRLEDYRTNRSYKYIYCQDCKYSIIVRAGDGEYIDHVIYKFWRVDWRTDYLVAATFRDCCAKLIKTNIQTNSAIDLANLLNWIDLRDKTGHSCKNR